MTRTDIDILRAAILSNVPYEERPAATAALNIAEYMLTLAERFVLAHERIAASKGVPAHFVPAPKFPGT